MYYLATSRSLIHRPKPKCCLEYQSEPVPFNVAITPDDAFAYVVNWWSHDVSVIDTSTKTEVLPRIPVGMNPFAVASAEWCFCLCDQLMLPITSR